MNWWRDIINGVQHLPRCTFSHAAIILVLSAAPLLSLGQFQMEWTAEYVHAPEQIHTGLDMHVDPNGTVYLYGYSRSDAGVNTGVLLKNVEGEWVWSLELPVQNIYGSMSVDHSGNILIATSGSAPSIGEHYRTMKISPDGVVLWTADFDGGVIPGGWDRSYAIAVGPDNSVFVTGWSEVVPFQHNAVTLKYDSLGNELWYVYYDHVQGAGTSEQGNDLLIDASGNVYVIGQTHELSAEQYYLFALKYSSSGALLWEYLHPGETFTDGRRAEWRPDGTIAIGGAYYLDGQGDLLCDVLDTTGALQWSATYNAPGDWQGTDWFRDIAVGEDGTVLLTGTQFNGSGILDDYLTVKYSSTGELLWARSYNGSTGHDDGYGVAVDEQGNVFVAGRSSQNSSSVLASIATLQYDTEGNLTWSDVYNEEGAGWYRPNWRNSASREVEGKLLVAGAQENSGIGGTGALVLLCYGTNTSTEDRSTSSFGLFPNPARNLIHVDVPCSGMFDWTLLDPIGRVLMKGRAIPCGSMTIDFRDLASGSYLLHVDGTVIHASQKVMVVP
ncbi:MAG TPA: SBBP repeat-containing protein [Flavobacteriales bacterium]|nr:SBBP repeat-containing protein [Flavobacteriales bacterium]